MNFGTVTYNGAHWLVECEPHVRARLKRVFPRAPQAAGEKLRISDTPENSRELLWFLQRYPMEVRGLSTMLHTPAEYLQAQSDTHIRMEASIADVLANRRPPLNIQMALPPRDYQSFAAQLLNVKGGLLLADDLGLGKTVTAMCPMALPDNLPALVVCPTHMPPHWVAFLKRFLPDLKVHALKSGRPYPLTKQKRQRTADLWPDRLPDVIVTNYHKLRGWAEVLGQMCRYVVFDEAQQLRNQGTDIYSACRHVAAQAKYRIGLTATPIYNYGSEFYWVVNALLPEALGQYDEFLREWCKTGFDKPRLADPEQFGAYLRREGIMLRRTRKDVGRELPALTKIVHEIDADTKVLDRIKGDAATLARIVLQSNEQFRGEKMKAAGEFDMLVRQATGVAKAPFVADFVRMLVESGEQILLFGWHHEVYGIWREKLADLNPVFFTGSETTAQKEAAKKAFIDGESKVLVMSLRSGAGVDGLQGHCRVAVFGELDWSPGVHEQCIGRIWRDGQQDEVIGYYMMAENGSDPIVADVLGVKREQIEGVRNPDSALAERIQTGEGHIRRLAAAYLKAHADASAAPAGATLIQETEPA